MHLTLAKTELSSGAVLFALGAGDGRDDGKGGEDCERLREVAGVGRVVTDKTVVGVCVIGVVGDGRVGTGRGVGLT